MSAPKRIQRRRTKGWRMPEGAVYVGRGTKWGNPYLIEAPNKHIGWRSIVRDGTDDAWPYEAFTDRTKAHQRAVDLYALHTGPVGNHEYADDTLTEMQSVLAGKDLACWCPLDMPCHADVLLEIANGEARP